MNLIEGVTLTKLLQIVSLAIIFLAFFGLSMAGGNQSVSPKPFKVANVHFEQNATDGDVEVVFEVKGGDEGLANLKVISPDGRTVVDFTADDASTLGIRQFRFETPEPKDVDRLISAYPEGRYTFSGTTSSGVKLKDKASLRHTLPAATAFLQPRTAAKGIGIKDLEITWTPVKNLAAYIIYIEQNELNVNLSAKLPNSTTSFKVPDNFLVPNTEYQLGLGTVMEGGNISFIETTFTTSEVE